jgi:hypothetical protein
MMKIERMRNGWIRTKGTLELITGDLEVTIQGPAKAWKQLPSPLGRESKLDKQLVRAIFFRDIIVPVRDFLQPSGRGVHSGREIFTRKMKFYCESVYRILEAWLDEPRARWPRPIEEAARGLEKPVHKRTPAEMKIAGGLSLTINQSKRIKRTDIAKLVAFCAEKYFQKERRQNGFEKWTEHFGTFRRTFIKGNRNMVPSGQKPLRQPSEWRALHKKYLSSDFKVRFERSGPPPQPGEYLSSK